MSPSPHRTRSSLSKANIGTAPILRDPLLVQHPRLLHIANELANWKCWKAVEEGHLQIVRRRTTQSPSLFIPRADVFDDSALPTIDAVFELPGLKSDEIQLTVKDGYLIVHGVRYPTYETLASYSAEGPSCRSSNFMDIDQTPVRELRYGPFQRRIKLPEGTKDSDISAKLGEGMLKISWPRAPASADSDTGVKLESLSPRATSASPEPPEGKIAAGAAQHPLPTWYPSSTSTIRSR